MTNTTRTQTATKQQQTTQNPQNKIKHKKQTRGDEQIQQTTETTHKTTHTEQLQQQTIAQTCFKHNIKTKHTPTTT